MMNFDALVAAIQRSALVASEAFVSKHLEILDRYFETTEEESEATIVEEAEKAVAASTAAAAAATSALELEGALAAIRQAAGTLETAAAKLAEKKRRSGTLRPKMTAIQFPQMTNQGPAVHTVHVPLLAIAPISFPRLSEMRFKTDLEMSIQDGKVEVGFRPSGDVSAERKENTVCASVEIVVSEAPVNRGLQLVVEGYERALRAQIPG